MRKTERGKKIYDLWSWLTFNGFLCFVFLNFSSSLFCYCLPLYTLSFLSLMLFFYSCSISAGLSIPMPQNRWTDWYRTRNRSSRKRRPNWWYFREFTSRIICMGRSWWSFISHRWKGSGQSKYYSSTRTCSLNDDDAIDNLELFFLPRSFTHSHLFILILLFCFYRSFTPNKSMIRLTIIMRIEK